MSSRDKADRGLGIALGIIFILGGAWGLSEGDAGWLVLLLGIATLIYSLNR